MTKCTSPPPRRHFSTCRYNPANQTRYLIMKRKIADSEARNRFIIWIPRRIKEFGIMPRVPGSPNSELCSRKDELFRPHFAFEARLTLSRI